MGGDLRPRPGGGGCRPDRSLDARARRPPGSRAGARRDPRPAMGTGGRVHRRGPVPGRHGGHGLRQGPAVRRCARDPQALPRILGLARRTQPCPGGHRATLDGRRLPAAVRDGAAGRRCALGDERLRRGRRGAHGVEQRVPHRSAARPPRVRRRGGRRLLRRGVPAPHARRRGRPGRSRDPRDHGRDRHRAAERGRLPRAGRSGAQRGAGRGGAGPSRAAGTHPEGGPGSARCDVRRRAPDRDRSRRARAAGGRAPARPGVPGAAHQRRDAPVGGDRRHRAQADRSHRPERRPRRGPDGLLLVHQPRPAAPPGGGGGHRSTHRG